MPAPFRRCRRLLGSLIGAALTIIIPANPGIASSTAAPAAQGGRVYLPPYTPAASYSEDLVIRGKEADVVLKRFVHRGKVRTEFTQGEIRPMMILEAGDSLETVYIIFTDAKMVLKLTRAFEETLRRSIRMDSAAAFTDSADFAVAVVTDLQDESLQGIPARKFRMTFRKSPVVTGWITKATNAPLRLVDGESTIEWMNRVSGPQPDTLFVIPKGFQVADLDLIAAKRPDLVARMPIDPGAFGWRVCGGPIGAAAGQFITGRLGRILRCEMKHFLF